MSETDVGAAFRALKDESDERARALQDRIARARRVIERSEAQLGRLRSELVRRAQEIANRYLDITEVPASIRQGRRRMPKWSLDEPIKKLIYTMPEPIVTIPQVCDEWNRQNPGREAGRTTIRGVLQRLAIDGHLTIVDPGRQGSRNVRQYQLASVKAESEGEDAITH